MFYITYTKNGLLVPAGVRGVMVIVAGDGHGDLSSKPGWGCLHFT